MAVHRTDPPDGSVRVKNVGGIRETTVEFSPGVTLLVGRNATNRTSFLRAMMAAVGSDDVSINGSVDEAEVELALGDETYTRHLERTPTGLASDGETYLDDSTVADLFAFLLESNEARRAVASGRDLREILMRPVDTESIRATIDDLVSERDRLEAELEAIADAKSELPDLEAERDRLQTEIEERRAELEVTEANIREADAEVPESRSEQSELDDRLAELREKRSTLDDVRYDLETERESLEALERERNEARAELDDLPEPKADDEDDLDARISRRRDEKRRLKAEINELQSIIGFNEEMLDDADSDVLESLRNDSETAVTDQLLADDTVICWTCGTEVDTDQVQRTVSTLQSLSQDKVSRVNDLQSTIEDLEAEKQRRQGAREERERLERRVREVETEIGTVESRIERLQERRASVTEEIEAVEAAVEALENESYSEVLELHREANQHEYQLGKLENDLERTEDRIRELEDRIATESDVRSKLRGVERDLVDARNRIERIEQTAVDAFNEHMDTILDLLAYENLERIWLERVESDGRRRRDADGGEFELHVVRSTDSGTVYEDTVEHLSESEREVTGLVFALAGYLAHDVYETVPFMLLDSLEAIDSDRIAALVEYLEEHAEYLLVALLPEDAAAVSRAGYEERTFGAVADD